MWLSTDNNTPVGVEVIGFHEDWIDEDFNPNGTRVCFKEDSGTWISAKWVDYQDTYVNNDELIPTHYMPMPIRP